ncbi:HNH endonuclease signature motif containing protein, partial [Aeromicrobium panaciterrae]|uniref:HNH endonuclease n=1 Tax=Aeromicrobium panaciterrae TaxID=363861 RepID=UPI0031D3AA86
HVQTKTEQPHLIPDPMPASVEPAKLAGHGAIGPNLLMYFLCVSDFTAFLMKQGGGARQAQILNAGTSKYQPTLTQRRAVIARQKGVCAAPGCNHTHLEIHHTIFWSMGGRTDLDLLIGLCVRCHHLLHRGLLNITGNAVNGFEFTNRHRRPIRRRRNHYHQAA